MSSGTRFHVSLNVSNLNKSVAFYRILFGQEPAKLHSDYAKFELEDPPVVLSLEPKAPGKDGALNHIGFRMATKDALLAMHARLEKAGLETPCETGVECCYARQTKFWTHDPDRTLWEVYTFDGDIEHRGAGQTSAQVSGAELKLVEPIVWAHRMSHGVPERVDHADGTVDEVRLQGTFNGSFSHEERQHLLREARRVLKPGGRIFIHVLTAERTLSGHPKLPGPASVVEHVPVAADVVELAQAAGFENVRMIKFDQRPCFEREGIPMRETQLEGWKSASPSKSMKLLYKGPFRELRDDHGNIFPRGAWVTADAALAERLRGPEWAHQFLVLE